ncbi:hypothetical protein MRX96_014057 [Rhipicephalus microplus]
MNPFFKLLVEYVCLSILVNLVQAFDEEFEKKWQSMHKRTALAPGTIVTIFIALMIAATCFSLLCFCLRRQRNIYNASPCVPPPLMPAAPVVTSGARTHAPLESLSDAHGDSNENPDPDDTYGFEENSLSDSDRTADAARDNVGMSDTF